MNKVLCLLVVMAVIAQIYSAPAENAGVDTAVKGAEGEVNQAADKVGKTAGSAGGKGGAEGIGGAGGIGGAEGIMKAPQAFLTFGKDVANDGEKLFSGVMGGFIPEKKDNLASRYF